MFLLDTMVTSELRKGRRSAFAVQAWSITTPDPLKFVSVITIQELRAGALRLRQKDPQQSLNLEFWIDNTVLPSFLRRILPVTLEVAERCAALHVPTQRDPLDMLIAATALVHNLTVVTRNTRHFEPTGVPTLNPWN